MALLKQMSNSGGATVCWCPFKEHKTLLAIGSKGATSFDDMGGELQIVDTSTRYPGLKSNVLGTVRSKAKFGSVAWGASTVGGHPMGLVAGGMSGGTVEIWDASKVASRNGAASAQVASVRNHKDSVNALAFNPHPSSHHILASASSDSEVNILDLSNPSAPNACFPSADRNDKHRGPVRCVAWNTKVDYILASASDDGTCIIWDLKRNKRWCTLNAPRGSVFADFAWHPSEGFQILTALADDSRPVVQVWDLRKSTTSPLGELRGHDKGLLSVEWSAHDPRLVMTSGNDSRTIMWDLTTGKPVYEIAQNDTPAPAPSNGVVTDNIFDSGAPTGNGGTGGDGEGNFWENSGSGGGAAASSGLVSNARRVDEISWSPHMPLVMSACTFDNKVEIFSMTTGACNTKRPPKWLGRRSGASFGFGGRLAAFGGTDRAVRLSTVGTNSEVLKRSQEFEDRVAKNDLPSMCRTKSEQSSDSSDTAVWDVMEILFDKDARRRLLMYLGFDLSALTKGAATAERSVDATSGVTAANDDAAAAAPIPTKTAEPETDANDLFASGPPTDSNVSADDFFGEGPPLADGPPLTDTVEDFAEPPSTSSEKVGEKTSAPSDDAMVTDTATDKQVKAAVMVGDFDSAVELSLAKGNMADALLLAPFGSDEIFTRARETYLRNQMRTRPFMRVVLAILTKRLDLYVAESDLRKWRESLAVIASYAQQDEFMSLCNALGTRLAEANPSDPEGAAVVCFMCAYNGEKVVEMWERRSGDLARTKGAEVALQELIERLSLFQAALADANNDAFNQKAVRHFTSYATLIAEQGRPDLALRSAKRFMTQNPSAASTDSELTEMVQRLEAMVAATAAAAARAAAPVVEQPRYDQSNASSSSYGANVPAATGNSWSTPHNADGFGTTDVPGGGQKYGNTSYLAPAPAHTDASFGGGGGGSHHYHQDHVRTAPTTDAGAYANGGYAATTAGPTQIFDPSKTSSVAAPTASTAPAPTPTPPKPDPPKVLAAELKPIVDSLNAAVARLKVAQLSSSEKRQIAVAERALNCLFAKLTNGAVEPHVCQQLHTIVSHVNTNNYSHAKHYYDHLVNTAWKTNREWLKDMKWLLLLGRKKLEGGH